MKKIRVLIVDDSALIRGIMKEIIDRAPDMETVGAAPDPLVAREMIRRLSPDVVTLDVEMPKMDGLDFLERLMRLRPTPVVMVSTMTERGADITLRALELGAVDFVSKPKIGIAQGMGECANEICDKIRAAAQSRVAHRAKPLPLPPPPAAADRIERRSLSGSTEKIVAIGASTGGTEAIREVLMRLPADFPAVAITQHMPPGFTRSFADRLNTLCRIRVKEAEDGERLLPGYAYIAPGGRHLALAKSGANYVVTLHDEAPVNRHRPSVDVLFRSVATHAGKNAIGVMLTGMGRDGADAMAAMHARGAYNIAQDEATSVVFGMPREAIAVGAVDDVLPLQAIADRLVAQVTHDGQYARV